MAKKKIVNDETADLLQEIKNGAEEMKEKEEATPAPNLEKVEVEEAKKPEETESLKKDEKKKFELPKPTHARPMKMPSVMNVKEVPDETLEVYNMLRSGFTQAEVRVMYAGWKDKKFNAIFGRAKEMMKQNLEDIDEARADIITRYNDLYRKAYLASNLRVCKEILDSMQKVVGLNREANITAEILTVWK